MSWINWVEIANPRPVPPYLRVVDVKGDLSGFICMVPARDADLDPYTHYEITSVCVKPGQQRRGIGTSMVRQATGPMVNSGVERLVVWVNEQNRAGQAFFRRLGFQPESKERFQQLGDYVLKYRRYSCWLSS